jgi:hypothetical protein
LTFAGVARFPKGSIESLQFCIGGLKNPVFRVVALEQRLKNSNLPIPSKLSDSLYRDLESELAEQVEDTPKGRYRAATSQRLVRWFLETINHRSLELF